MNTDGDTPEVRHVHRINFPPSWTGPGFPAGYPQLISATSLMREALLVFASASISSCLT